MADKRVNIILQEVNQEYSMPTYMEDYLKGGVARALKNIDRDKELLADLMIEQQEGA